jgi:hypothetical protein
MIMDPKLTFDQEMEVEWRYRYHERIGMMCDAADPTDRQKQIARCEADEAVAKLRNERRSKFKACASVQPAPSP